MSPDFLRAMRVSRSGNNLLGHWLRTLANKVETCSVSVWLVGLGTFAVFLIVAVYHHIFLTAMEPAGTVSSSASSSGPFMAREDIGICSTRRPCWFKIVADLDVDSKFSSDDGKTKFRSHLTTGRLSSSSPPLGAYSVNWGKTVELIGLYNEGGRGMELSELVMFNGKLLAFDDRTGIGYEVSQDNKVIPRHVLTEGSGEFAKGMKVEWATEKEGKLYVGSFGKEFTSTDGLKIVGENNFWVATISPDGHVEYENWKAIYNKIRDKLGVPFPGYALHEAVNWNPHSRKWVFLPRRISAERYDEAADERRGSNKIVVCNEDFTDIQVHDVGKIIPERGFSSFKFVPGTNGEVLAALKSVENAETGTQATYLSVFTVSGAILMPDTEVPKGFKYEGIEFVQPAAASAA